ncbi:MAG TPA: fumarylacetoacetate hydrolase [Burkholderiales bacterium]|nr:fumarylacetoacetate hydrolase [Burkholderiales bacterium]
MPSFQPLAVAALCQLAVATASFAACPDDPEVAAYLADYQHTRLTRGMPSVATLADGLCAQKKLVLRLSGELGPVAGYKAGFTNEAVQKAFGISHPIRGVLLRDMLLADGAALPATFGARPLWEADLMVRIGRAGLHRAATPLEALEYIDAVVPFMELPDTMFDPQVKMTASGLVAINVGARLGALGRPITVERSQAFVDLLAAMTVVIEENGVELGRAPGSVMMGNPLNSAIWLAQDLAKAGVILKPGDLLSLGSFLPLQQPKPGTTVAVRYLGLPADPVVSVTFR